MKYTLLEPVVIEGDKNGTQTIAELNIREKVVAGDMRGLPLDKMEHDHMIRLISRLSGQPEFVIAKLSIQDYVALAGKVDAFMEGGPQTGKKD